MATQKQIAFYAIREVHANTAVSLDELLADLEDIRDLADELVEAIQADIAMQSKQNEPPQG